MTNAIDLSRWREAPRGVGYRRWTMISSGLRHLLRTKLFIGLLGLAWVGGLLIAAIGYAFAQSVATGGWLETFATKFGPRAEATVTALGGLIAMFPDICIGGLFTLTFWLHSYLGLILSLIALTAMVPRLVSDDRASNALTIYLSRPLTSTDYLLGKLGTIVGVLLLLWTGPLLFGWIVSMALAPDREFIIYSLSPLLHALLFNAIALVVLATIALGVSAASSVSRGTTLLWIMLWIVAGSIASLPRAPDWLARASFSHDLDEVRRTVFQIDSALINAGTKLPLANPQFAANLAAQGERVRAHDFNGALIGLAVLIVGSSAIFFRKFRPE